MKTPLIKQIDYENFFGKTWYAIDFLLKVMTVFNIWWNKWKNFKLSASWVQCQVLLGCFRKTFYGAAKSMYKMGCFFYHKRVH